MDREWLRTLHDGVIYWNVNCVTSRGHHKYENSCRGILGFHLTSEEFVIINVPNNAK